MSAAKNGPTGSGQNLPAFALARSGQLIGHERWKRESPCFPDFGSAAGRVRISPRAPERQSEQGLANNRAVPTATTCGCDFPSSECNYHLPAPIEFAGDDET